MRKPLAHWDDEDEIEITDKDEVVVANPTPILYSKPVTDPPPLLFVPLPCTQVELLPAGRAIVLRSPRQSNRRASGGGLDALEGKGPHGPKSCHGVETEAGFGSTPLRPSRVICDAVSL